MIQLRDYQTTAVESVRNAFKSHRRVLLVMATGAGKTVTFSYICRGAQSKGNNVLILAHRQELLDQISISLAQFSVPHGFIAAGYPSARGMVHVGSTQTVIRRVKSMTPPRLIIIDEAHHATKKNTLGQILAAFPNANVLGVTATPVRLSGEGLGEVFQTMILGPQTAELIERGALSPCKVYAPPGIDTSGLDVKRGDFVISELAAAADKPKITGDAVDHYRKHADRKRGVAFCVSVEHAQHVANQFCEAGYSAVRIDGAMDRHERRRIVQSFRDGAIHVITSCDLISEGFDLPAIECGISLRPTASAGLWLQQVGRCLRTYPGKEHAVILDHAGNTLRHGLPTEPREWSLDASREKRGASKSDASPAVRVCPQCFAASPSGTSACRSCGHVFPVQARKVDHVDGELQEVTFSMRRKASPQRIEQGMAKDLDALIHLGKMRGYKDPAGWATHIIMAREQKQSRRA